MGGTAQQRRPGGLAPWLATLAAGLLLVTAGVAGLRRSRHADAVARQ
jgi:hypothetical protein